MGLTRNTPVTPDGKSAVSKLRKENYRYEQEALQRKHYQKYEHQLSPQRPETIPFPPSPSKMLPFANWQHQMMGYPPLGFPYHPNVNLTFNFADNANRNTVQINMPQSNEMVNQKEKKEVQDLKEKFGTDMQKSNNATPELQKFVSVNDIQPGVVKKMSFMDKLGEKLEINQQLKAETDQLGDMLATRQQQVVQTPNKMMQRTPTALLTPHKRPYQGVGIEVVTELQHHKNGEMDYYKPHSAFKPFPIVTEEPKFEPSKIAVPAQSLGETNNHAA